MRNIALFLTYEGTAYHGWQMQKGLATVQQTLEKAISMVVSRCRCPCQMLCGEFPHNLHHSCGPYPVCAQHPSSYGYRGDKGL